MLGKKIPNIKKINSFDCNCTMLGKQISNTKKINVDNMWGETIYKTIPTIYNL